VDTTKAITHLSLCSGYEGIGLGLRSVLPTLREVAYVEREGFPIANLVAKMEAGKLDAAPVFTDVKTFPYGEFRGLVDILSGGFPCQPFSAAGKRQATEDPRHLFPYIADGIRECQPRIVFLENVQGILSCKTADGEPVLQYVLRELEGMGYRATAGIFSAEEVGAPHQRKRVYILGMANSERGGMRGGGSSQECGDDLKWIQGNEGERNELRSEAEGCSRDSREELANSHGSESSEGRGDNGEVPEVSSVERTDFGSTLPRGKGYEGKKELANSNRGRGEIQNQGQLTSEQMPECNGSSWGAWPSRPGEPQHDWEEPRVTEQAEPQLGRASNGSSSRVDRLRLLGNGVVPATAAKAFITLINRLI